MVGVILSHLGGVRIGDWVDIGAHSCVCRGMLSDTTVGDSAKVGSLVYLSHGTTVGDHAWCPPVSAAVAAMPLSAPTPCSASAPSSSTTSHWSPG